VMPIFIDFLVLRLGVVLLDLYCWTGRRLIRLSIVMNVR
jgi:hypothetical protein